MLRVQFYSTEHTDICTYVALSVMIQTCFPPCLRCTLCAMHPSQTASETPRLHASCPPQLHGDRSMTGRLLISLELLPKDAADAQPVGAARNEPNQNPYLPPPAGRMKMSFNPFRLSMSLLGPKAFYKVRYSKRNVLCSLRKGVR